MPKVYLIPEALTVPMGSLGCAGMLPARRMAEHRMFIMSQVAIVGYHTCIMYLFDCVTYRKAGLGGEPYKGETPPDLPVLTS